MADWKSGCPCKGSAARGFQVTSALGLAFRPRWRSTHAVLMVANGTRGSKRPIQPQDSRRVWYDAPDFHPGAVRACYSQPVLRAQGIQDQCDSSLHGRQTLRMPTNILFAHEFAAGLEPGESAGPICNYENVIVYIPPGTPTSLRVHCRCRVR